MFDEIESIVNNARKKFGKESAYILSSNHKINVPTIRSGVPQIDLALGIGGWPRGRIVEIYGSESSGKTTLALHAIANAQKKGNICAFVDAEHALDPDWAEKIGVDKDGMIISQPNSGEEALDLVQMYAEAGVGIVVIDSVAALTPEAELTADMGATHMGLQARLMGQAMRKLRGILRETNTLCLFLNQIRHKIGVVFGSPITTPGGNALKFFSSIRLELSAYAPKEGDKQGDKVVSRDIRFKVVKNKLAPPFKIGTAKIGFENGFDLANNLIDGMMGTGSLEKTGNTYSYNEEKIAVGKNKVIEYFRNLDEDTLEGMYDNLILDMNEEYQELKIRKQQIEKNIIKRKEKNKDVSDKEEELKGIEEKIARIKK